MTMHRKIDLGSRNLHAQKSGLELSVDGSAEFLLSAECNNLGNTEEIEELLLSRKIWTTQATELNIYICVSMQAGYPNPPSALFPQIGDIVCNAKLWSDLGLVALLKSCESDPNSEKGTSDFRASIGLRRIVGPLGCNMKTWRLPVSMRNFHEAAPPADIPTAILSSISLSFKYKYSQEGREVTMPYCPVAGTSAEDSTIPESETRTTDGSAQKDDIFDVFRLEVEHPQRLGGPGNFDIDGFSEFEWELQELEEEQSILPDSPFDEKDSVFSENRPCPNVQDFYELFSVAFRTLMVPGSLVPSIGIKLRTNDSLRSLSEIAPAVFCLGYRDAMSQRSRLIPSMAKSMASIIEKTSNCDVFHQEECSLQLRNKNINMKSNPIQNGDLKGIIKNCLWKIAQRDLYNPRASRKLPPLHLTSLSLLPGSSKPSTMYDPPLLLEEHFSLGDPVHVDSDEYYTSDNTNSDAGSFYEEANVAPGEDFELFQDETYGYAIQMALREADYPNHPVMIPSSEDSDNNNNNNNGNGNGHENDDIERTYKEFMMAFGQSYSHEDAISFRQRRILQFQTHGSNSLATEPFDAYYYHSAAEPATPLFIATDNDLEMLASDPIDWESPMLIPDEYSESSSFDDLEDHLMLDSEEDMLDDEVL